MAGVPTPAIVARSVLTAGLRGCPGSPAVSFRKLSGGLDRELSSRVPAKRRPRRAAPWFSRKRELSHLPRNVRGPLRIGLFVIRGC